MAANESNAAYGAVLQHLREAHLIESTGEILSWDQETMMPPGGVSHRAQQLALLARLAHERASDPRIPDWIDSARAGADDDPNVLADLRVLARDYQRRTRVPAALVAETTAVASEAQHVWARARKESDFSAFAPSLERLVRLARERADALGVPENGSERWDALAEDYEPGMRAQALEALFTPLAEGIGRLLDRAMGGPAPDARFHALAIPVADQEKVVRSVAAAMGFDFDRGRLDQAAHPFCGGSHCGDVRLTTRFHRDNFADALGSTMHEAGHGLYEQGLAADAVGSPAGTAVSLGIHESQSRLWENHVGRSRPFWEWLRPQLVEAFGPAMRGLETEELYRAVNRVTPSLIRVEADEVTYHLHVIIRFELERALIDGSLEVRDLPEAWREAYRRHLNIEVPDDRRGCLQDVHWSCGLFGYFPTYTLGSIYAAQFHAAAARELDGLEEGYARGEFGALLEWLRQRVHAQGRRLDPEELCRSATGQGLAHGVLQDYLAAKVEAVYGPA